MTEKEAALLEYVYYSIHVMQDLLIDLGHTTQKEIDDAYCDMKSSAEKGTPYAQKVPIAKVARRRIKRSIPPTSKPSQKGE
jgi:hypothetical protein